MKLLCLTIAILGFIAGAVFLSWHGYWKNWPLSALSLLCAASCRMKAEALP